MNQQILTTINPPKFSQDALARMVIMRAAEPQDHITQHLIASLGTQETAALYQKRQPLTSALGEKLAHNQLEDPEKFMQQVADRVKRWSPRVATYDPHQEARFASKLGAWLLTPEDANWPAGLNDFGFNAPYGLWGRGDKTRLDAYKESRSLAVVGSRDISSYGNSATQHLAGELAQAGLTIVSGGAFGIDAVAHSSALATGNGELPTIAFMAGGIDGLYPKHNENLLHHVIDRGLIFSEVPMGQAPTRWRFLHRNRLIAGISRATIVVEARWRSGALNTANHALELGRPVYAVPGSIFSPSSEGCHRLIKDGLAQVLTDPQALIQEFAEPLAEQTSAFAANTLGDSTDYLSSTEKLIWDSLTVRRTMSIEELATSSGLSARTCMVTLSKLAAQSLAVQDTATLQWKKKVPKKIQG